MFLVTDWNTILIALIAMVGTSFAGWIAYLTAKTNRTLKATEEAAHSITKIETQTNGNLSRLTTELQVEREKVAGLEKLVAAITPTAPIPVKEEPKA